MRQQVEVISEYLMSYGTAGDFGRFRPTRQLVCHRGDHAVVRSHRGLELATVLCDAAAGHARFLPNTSVGELIRLANAEDETSAARLRDRGHLLLQRACALVGEQALPLEILDIDVLLDNQNAVVQYLSWGDFDPRPFVSRLSSQSGLQIALHSLVSPREETEDVAGCGRPDCGQAGGGGGCSSCGADGGCATCGSAKSEDVQAYFAGLREKINRVARTPLL
jgi:hypothetical protein